MARKFQTATRTGKNVLLIDDDKVYMEATRKILENEGHTVVSAENGQEALDAMKSRCFDVLLVDYYMPGMTGEELVRKIRETNSIVQIILQTGYADEQPSRDLIKRLDIQGYFNKSEGPETFLLWVDVGIKASANIMELNKSREGLKYILEKTPDLQKIQSLDHLLEAILDQIMNLVQIERCCITKLTSDIPRKQDLEMDCFIAIMEEYGELNIRTGNGKMKNSRNKKDFLNQDIFSFIRDALDKNRITRYGQAAIIPLVAGEKPLGIIYIDQLDDSETIIEILKIFADQAAVAMQNVKLYQQATYDPLTRIFMRGVFIHTMIRELRIAFRSKKSLCLMLIDIDGMKHINDNYGHLAGDQALKNLSDALVFATRQTDLRGRLGGDEFAVLLIDSDRGNLKQVGGRIYEFLDDKTVRINKKKINVKCSIGACEIGSTKRPEIDFPPPKQYKYFQFICRKMLQKADEALYGIKKTGGNAFNEKIAITKWLTFEQLEKDFEGQDFDLA